jgi:hypothetical protein
VVRPRYLAAVQTTFVALENLGRLSIEDVRFHHVLRILVRTLEPRCCDQRTEVSGFPVEQPEVTAMQKVVGVTGGVIRRDDAWR